MTLHVSIIIPSAGRRPEFLQRAIKSALIDDDNIQTEIIVMLNGQDGIAFDINQSFQHPLVNYHKIEQGNVCKARNYGLSLAQGELIRFLDDDDFLYPDVAYQQYIELFHSNADLSTYAGAIEDEHRRYQVIEPIDIGNYCAATLSAYCPALTFATVYRSKVIKHLKWDESLCIPEDEHWMRTIAAEYEIKWIRSINIVAVWYQHDIDRFSSAFVGPDYFRNRYNSISTTLETLRAQNRLNTIKINSAIKGYWSCIHGGFYFAPFYWTKIALHTRQLDPKSKPNDKIFNILPQWVHPLVIEWLMLPKRWLNYQTRLLKQKIGCNSFIRKI